jgi:hypothetical protein
MYSIKRPATYRLSVVINGHRIEKVKIGRHYQIKHGHYMNDVLILGLVTALDGGSFPVDSTADSIEYYAADVEFGLPVKIYRIIWLFEGKQMKISGVINAYRRKRGEK